MITMEYTYQLSEAELGRYRAMAAGALASEETLWTAAGIVPGARVVDLGCGPGSPELAYRWPGTGWMPGPRPAAVTVRSYEARRAAASAGSVRHAVPAGRTE